MRELGRWGAFGGARANPTANGGDLPAVLTHDGKVIHRGTWNECLKWLQDHQSCSWHHAFTYEGYQLNEVFQSEPPTCELCKAELEPDTGQCPSCDKDAPYFSTMRSET